MRFEKLEIVFRLPHQGMVVGFEVFEPDNEYPFFTTKFHVLLISFAFDFSN
jgi:hypothetical protein